MATSVVLRACGGLGPYSWVCSSGLALSSSSGTQVSVSSANSTGYILNLTYTTGAKDGSAGCFAGACNGLLGDPTNQSPTLAWQKCVGGVITDTGSCQLLFQSSSQTDVIYSRTCTTLGATTLTADISGTCGNCPVVCCMQAVLLSVNLSIPGIPINTTYSSSNMTAGTHTYEIYNTINVTGETVTVTDAAGTSVTYVF